MSADLEKIRLRLGVWDRVVVADGPIGGRRPAQVRDARSVLRRGASESELVVAESKHRLAFPASYRAFLQLSDGAYADPRGMVSVASAKRRQYSSVPGLGFLAVADVRPLNTVEPAVVEAFTQDPYVGQPRTAEGAAPASTQPLLDSRTLLISSVEGADMTALVPVDDGSEWELWQLTRDDIAAYSSFAAWLEYIVESPDNDQVMQLVSFARANDARGNDLGRIRDPRALPILVAALEEFPDSDAVRGGALTALGRIKSDAAVPVLERYLDESVWRTGVVNTARRALHRIGSTAARDVLASNGDYRELLELGDDRAGAIAAQRLAEGEFWAATVLRELADPAYVPELRRAWTRVVEPGHRVSVALALHACGDPEGRRYLQELADDDQFHFQSRAQSILDELTTD